jgi:iron(III) transport system ATP-binding protein
MSILLKAVGKRYGHQEVLHSIDLMIRDGEFIAVLGPSGCGKTTLLRLLAGFEAPSVGEIYFGDQKIASDKEVIPAEKRNVGMVFQSFALWPHLSVRNHVEFPLKYGKKLTDEKRVDKVLQVVGLSALADRLPNELSGGQKQRVSFARAIAASPSVLLMDEPLSSLDAELRMEMRREIQQLHRYTKATIVYVTHDQGEALAMAERIVIMKDGKIEQIGTPQEIFHRPKTAFVATFVGKANLIQGEWKREQFKPIYAEDGVFWTDTETDEFFRKKGLFPLRPEQLIIHRCGPGVKGKIINSQFQGKEIHYTVQVQDKTWEVYTNVFQVYQVGEEVFVKYKSDAMSLSTICQET